MAKKQSESWREKVVPPEKALERVEPGMSIFLGTGMAEPRTLVKHLMASDQPNLQDLELIQLMEQGDQVVKSPWSSWQFGMNYYYSGWNGVYKGMGDKAEKYPYEGVYTRSSDLFLRSISPYSRNYSRYTMRS